MIFKTRGKPNVPCKKGEALALPHATDSNMRTLIPLRSKREKSGGERRFQGVSSPFLQTR